MRPAAKRAVLFCSAIPVLLRKMHVCKTVRMHLVARAAGIWGCLTLGGGWRRYWQDDLGRDLPVLPDLYPIYNHQKRLGRSVLPRIRDRDIHRRVGFRYVRRPADDLELRA